MGGANTFPSLWLCPVIRATIVERMKHPKYDLPPDLTEDLTTKRAAGEEAMLLRVEPLAIPQMWLLERDRRDRGNPGL
jgi:hypothetical protein